MFTVEQVVDDQIPWLHQRFPRLRLPILRFLRLIAHEARFRAFELEYPHLEGFDFVDKVLEHFDFSYAVRSDERERIPAGEVSRLAPQGVRDGRWRSGFLKLARRARAPVLPVHVDGRNSLFFYAVSLLARPLSTLLLVREMFLHASSNVAVRIGQPIAPAQYALPGRSDKWIAKRFRRQVYALGKSKRKAYFEPPARAVAHPENRQLLRLELKRAERIGRSRDDKTIHLFRCEPDSVVMREIGRLRELAFRAVGEGSGERRDTDRFDQHYEHIVLWDDEDLEIVGAYRMMHAGAAHSAGRCLYTETLFVFDEAMQAYWPQAMELGRSFVQPRYWGRRGLDYLWYGIGARVGARSDCRYLFGPVTIPNNYPAFAKDLLVCFYRHYFPAPVPQLAQARRPYEGVLASLADSQLAFRGDDYEADFALLRDALGASGLQVPTLFRRYTEAVQPGGAFFLAFNVDPDFGHCVDGLILLDLARLRYTYRQRYLSAPPAGAESGAEQCGREEQHAGAE